MKKESIFIYGVHAVLEKLHASGGDVEEVLIARASKRPVLRVIEMEARRRGVRVDHVAPTQLSRLAAGNPHQGVVARVVGFNYLNFDDLMHEMRTPVVGNERILILDSLTDPRNFGALLRIAEAVGIRHVVIPKDRSVDVTPTVARASSGAVHYLKIYKIVNLRQLVLALKDLGFWTVGLDIRARRSLYDSTYPNRLVVILGSEGKGIRPLLLRECDLLVSIPMLGTIGSLNVAVAGAVFLYEILRQGSGRQ